MRSVVAALALFFAAAPFACAGKPSSTVSANVTGAPAYKAQAGAMPYRLVFDNQMGASFRFERIVILLDKAEVLTGEQHDALREHVRAGHTANIDVRVAPGEHQIQLLVDFTGGATE